MRTNIDIDDKLLKEAMKLSRIKIKKDLVNAALNEMIKSLRREEFKSLRGKVIWEGNLEEMRTYDKWDND